MAKQWHQLERLDHKALKKLQAEREKAAKLQAQKAQKTKAMIIATVILLVLFCLGSLIVVIKNNSDKKSLEEAKEKLLYSNVSEYTGSVEYRTEGDWTPLTTNIKFKDPYLFRISDESSVSIQLQRENLIKAYSFTEFTVKPPILAKEEADITKQIVELDTGELTTAISIDGRGLLSIQVSNITVTGQSGLFKIIYNKETNKGEVVVKNGLVEVSKTGYSGKPVKLSGFYKVTFEDGDLSTPTQASVIQYDWR